VDFSGGDLVLKDVVGNTRHVVKQEGLYNQICREYWFDGTGNNQTTFMASDAVVHLIDGPLLFENLTPWKTLIGKIRRK
jgi:hypothetical protein